MNGALTADTHTNTMRCAAPLVEDDYFSRGLTENSVRPCGLLLCNNGIYVPHVLCMHVHISVWLLVAVFVCWM